MSAETVKQDGIISKMLGRTDQTGAATSAETITLAIHREKPPEPKELPITVLAKRKGESVCGEFFVRTVANEWENFEWWSEIPAPVKPKRFVVIEVVHSTGVWYAVHDTLGLEKRIAWFIPTREAAQRIADIYEDTTP